MTDRTYLDHNATMPLRPEAKAAIIAAMDVAGNPSSVHAEGRAAKGLIERARAQVAALAGCEPKDVIFTSGATEAAKTAVHAVQSTQPMICAEIEHDAVLAHCASDIRLPVDAEGRLVLDQGRDDRIMGAVSTAPMVAIQAANSETGVLQDVPGTIRQIKDRVTHPPRFLCDAVQAWGKIPVPFGSSGADMALVSAHKLGGPKGIGALILRPGLNDVERAPLIQGGGQEMGRRSGTENVIGIAGFGAAAEAAARDLANGLWGRIEKLRNILETALAAETQETIFVGNRASRLPNTACFATPGWKGETQVMQMDLAGFAISAGSACSSGKVRASRVLLAMGYAPDVASSAVRVSLGPETTEEDVLRFVEAWCAKEKKHRARAA